jgi:lysophospholipase L1-like esterase
MTREVRRRASGRAWLCVAFGFALAVSGTAIALQRPGQSGRLPRVARQLASRLPVRIVAFGSSSTEGVGATSPSATYPARLETELNQALPGEAKHVSVLNRGVGGEDVDDMLARLDRDVLAAKPDLVIWQTGSNDPLRSVPLARFFEETKAGIGKMRAAGLDVMLMEPQWCPKLQETAGADLYREAVRSVGSELAVPVIRRADLMRKWVAENRLSSNQLLSKDGFHMTDGGYALLAREIANEILSAAQQTPDQA